MIVVERGRYNLKTKHETTQKSYWIYNQVLDDERFNEMTKSIRNHWEVEVHHQIRDKQMGESDRRCGCPQNKQPKGVSCCGQLFDCGN